MAILIGQTSTGAASFFYVVYILGIVYVGGVIFFSGSNTFQTMRSIVSENEL